MYRKTNIDLVIIYTFANSIYIYVYARAHILSYVIIKSWLRPCALQQTRALPSAIALGKEGFALGKELSAYPFTAKASLPSAFCQALGKAFFLKK